jgi:hypothetical protein
MKRKYTRKVRRNKRRTLRRLRGGIGPGLIAHLPPGMFPGF